VTLKSSSFSFSSSNKTLYCQNHGTVNFRVFEDENENENEDDTRR
jgi:hypothetical protein